MTDIIEILGAFGDDKPHYAEEVFEVIRIAKNDRRWTPKFIQSKVMKYAAYGMLVKVPDTTFKGYHKWQLSKKGSDALDYYRNLHHRDPAEGVLF
jgi:hypothetical protein